MSQNNEPYVTKINGQTVLIDSAGVAFARAVSKHNCAATFRANADRVEHFARRQAEMGRNDTVIVVLNVDTQIGSELAAVLMPGHDWQALRDQGAVPFARGLATRDGIQDWANLVDPEAGIKLRETPRPVVVVDFDVVEVFSSDDAVAPDSLALAPETKR